MRKPCKKHDKISECADCGKKFWLVPVEKLKVEKKRNDNKNPQARR